MSPLRHALAITQGFALLVLGVSVLGCFGEPDLAGLEEPLRVVDGHFKEGRLPGLPPVTTPSDEPPEGPRITGINFANFVLHEGQVALPLGGNATVDAWSIAIQLEGLGSGYWIHTSGFEDAQVEGERTWDLTLNLGYDIPAGPQKLLIVAIDKEGHAGVQSALDVCIASTLPDNGYACDDTRTPPAAIAVLEWNEDADVDLIVRDPAGNDVGSDPALGTWHGPDAAPNCQVDSVRRETVVWNSTPGAGLWAVYANLNDPCGHLAVSYRLRYFIREEREDGTFELVDHHAPITGQFLRAQANGGAKSPTFIVQIRF